MIISKILLSGTFRVIVACLIMSSLRGVAQSPDQFSYQAVIRDDGGQLVVEEEVGIKLSILQGSSVGSAVYEETHTVNTNANGLVTLAAGGGVTTDDFSAIDWSAGPYFIKTEIDPTGGETYTITGTSQLLSVPYALYAAKAPTVPSYEVLNPYEVYVQAGAVDGDGSRSNPFATIQQGIAAVTATGTVHILRGSYPVTTTITVNKAGITLRGYPGAVINVEAAVIGMTIVNSDVTVEGLTFTSDAAYAAELLQVGGTNHKIVNNHFYGPTQAGPSTGWVVNRAIVTQINATSNLLFKGNTVHSLRMAAYLNPNTSGVISGNVVYDTRGFVVDGATFIFSGNSWGIPANAVDIALLVGTATGSPYDPLTNLSNSNSAATISDQR